MGLTKNLGWLSKYITADSTGKIGIGATSPSYKLDVLGDIGAYANADNNGFIGTSGGTHLISLTRLSNNAKLSGYDGVVFYTNATTLSGGSERMRITSGGNVGIGTSSPNGLLHLYGGDSNNPAILTLNSISGGGGNSGIYFRPEQSVANSNIHPAQAAILAEDNNFSSHIKFLTKTTGAIGNSLAERMRITSGGDVCIGTTSSTAGGVTVKTHISGTDFGLGISVSAGGSQQNIRFVNGTTAVGSVTTTGSTTSYNMVSDYRLKEDFKDYTGLDLISKIKTYDYKWKESETRMYGVVAHELQEVVPYAVTGEKDADEMQSVDYSKLVPILVQAIQELTERIKTLENK